MQNLYKWLLNLKVQQKELFLIAVMSIFLIFIGFIGFYLTKQANNRAASIYQDNLLAIQNVNNIRVQTRANQADLFHIMMENDPDLRQQVFADLQERIALWRTAFNSYKNSKGLDSYEKAQLPLLKKEMAEYSTARDTTINLIVDGKQAEAFKYYKKHIYLLNRFNERLKDIAFHNEDRARNEYARIQKASGQAISIIAVSILLALLGAISLGMIISSMITKPILVLRDRMQMVSEGNMQVTLLKTLSTNEIGQVAEAFNVMYQSLRDFVQRERFLRNVVISSISTLQTNKVLKSVVVETGKLFGATRCYFTQYSAKDQSFLPIREFELYQSYAGQSSFVGLNIDNEYLAPFIKILLGQKQPIAIENIEAAELSEEAKNWFRQHGIKSYIAAPVIYMDKPLGVLVVDFNSSLRPITSADVDLVMAIAGQAAVVVYQTQLFAEVQSAKNRETVLRKISDSIRTSLDMSETLNIVSAEILDLFKSERVLIVKKPENEAVNGFFVKSVLVDYFINLNMKAVSELSVDIEVERCWSAVFFKTGGILAIEDIETSDVPSPFKSSIDVLGIKAIMTIPIKRGKDIWGTISVASSSIRKWAESEIDLLETISSQVYIAIKQAELYSAARRVGEREALLRNIVEAVIATQDINDTLSNICDKVGALFQADRALIVEVPDIQDPSSYVIQREYLSFKSIEGVMDAGLYRGIVDFWVKNVLINGNILALDDINKANISNKLKDEHKSLDIASMIAVPIQKGRDKYGLLSLSFAGSRQWTEDEINLLSSISDHIYLAIRQYELFNQTRQIAERESLLRRIIDTVRGTLSIEDIKQNIVNEVGRSLNADRCFIRIFDKETDGFLPIDKEYKSSPDVLSVMGANFNIKADEGFKFKHKNKLTYLMPDVQACFSHPECDPELINLLVNTYGVKSNYSIPIYFEDNFLGMFVLHYIKEIRQLRSEEVELLISVAYQSGIALRQAQLYAEAAKNAERESLLRRIISTVRNTLDIDDVFNTIAKEISKNFNIDRITISEVADKKNIESWQIRKEYKSRPDIIGVADVGFDKRVGNYNSQIVFEYGKLIVPDMSQAPVPDYYRETYVKLGTKAFAAFPVKREGDNWGILALSDTKGPRKWPQDEIDSLQAISDQIYIAIKQAELYSATKRQAARADLSRRIIDAIGTHMELGKVLNIICAEILGFFPVDRVAIELFTPESDFSEWEIKAEVMSGTDILGTNDVDYAVDARKYIGRKVLDEDTDIVFDDIEKADLSHAFLDTHKKMNTKSFVAVPIKQGADKLGVLVLAKANGYKQWTNEEVDLLHAISDQIYIAILQAKLYSKVEENARRENILRTITNSILTSLSLEAAVSRIVEEIGILYDVERVAFRQFDSGTVAFSEVKGEYRKGSGIPSSIGLKTYPEEVDNYIVSLFSANKKIEVIEDIDNPVYPQIFRDMFKSLNVKAVVIVPVKYGNSFLGVLFLTNTHAKQQWNKSEIEFLAPIAEQVAIGINMFHTMDKLTKSLGSERIIREIIFSVQEEGGYKEIFRLLLSRLCELFGLKRGLHLHYDDRHNLIVHNEVLLDDRMESLIDQTILNAEHTQELEPHQEQGMLIVDDADKSIKDKELREFLKRHNIAAFIVYPVAPNLSEDQRKVMAITMLCSSIPKRWLSTEIESFKLGVDMTSLAYLQAQQKNEIEETRKTFLATLTHDLRSPINGEQKALEFILSRKPETQLNEFTEFLQGIYKTNEELLRIVNNILTVYHYESGRFTLNLHRNSIQEVLIDASRTMSPLAKDEESEINTNLEENLPEFLFDKDEIRRVLVNLINNAIKHNRKKTVINVSARRVGEEVEISVSDNGEGISEDDKKIYSIDTPLRKDKLGQVSGCICLNR